LINPFNGQLFNVVFVCSFDDVKRHFQQYFSYMLTVKILLVEETGGPVEDLRPVASH